MTGIALTAANAGTDTAISTGTTATGSSDTAAVTDTGNPGAAADTGIKVGSSDTSKDAADTNSPWYASFKDDGIKALAESKKWASSEDALKSYKELEAAYSGKRAALAPKTAADYQFTKPENLPEGTGYNDTFAGNFKSWAKEQELTNEQAAFFHDKFVAYATETLSGAHAERQAEVQRTVVDTEKTLKKEWGATDNPAFQRNMEMARRAMNELGIMDDMKTSGVLTEIGGTTTVTNAKMFMALAKVGSAMFAEDSSYGKSSVSSTNPFDPKTLNLAAQGDLFTKDPAKAAMWIDQLPPNERLAYTGLRQSLKAKGF